MNRQTLNKRLKNRGWLAKNTDSDSLSVFSHPFECRNPRLRVSRPFTSGSFTVWC